MNGRNLELYIIYIHFAGNVRQSMALFVVNIDYFIKMVVSIDAQHLNTSLRIRHMPANSRYKTLLCVFPTVCAEMGKIWCNSNVIDHVISLQNRSNVRIAEVGCSGVVYGQNLF